MKLFDVTSALVLVGLLVASILVYRPVDAPRSVELTMLDVGQGDAFLVEGVNGSQMLVDTGPPGSLLEPLQQVMGFFDRYIDVLLLTHPDADHIGGVPELLERYDIGVIVTAPADCHKELCTIIDSLASRYDIATRTVQFGSEIDLGGGLLFDVLWPVIASKKANNNTSIVGILSYGSTSVMFTGDAGANVEGYLADTWGDLLDIDVLKVGHHGSKTSTSQLFLDTTTPQYVLISAGFNNQYGHPSPEVIERIVEATEEIFETQEYGTVQLYSDGSFWTRGVD